MRNIKSITWALCVMSAVLGFTVGSAQAALIDNGGTTVDTTAGLEWLDVTSTAGQSYNAVIGGFGGYISSGYRYANTTELCSLFTAAGDVLPNCTGGSTEDALTPASAAQLVSLLGDTLVVFAASGQTAGMYDSGGIGSSFVGLGLINALNTATVAITSTNNVAVTQPGNPGNLPLDLINGAVGSFLVRDVAAPAIPEPAIGFPLMLAGFLGLAAIRRRGLKSA
jgi:hypothetical protein